MIPIVYSCVLCVFCVLLCALWNRVTPPLAISPPRLFTLVSISSVFLSYIPF